MSEPTTRTAVAETSPPPTNRITSALAHVVTDLGRNGIFVALIAVVVLFSITTNGVLLRPQNISNLIVQNGYILVLAIGMVFIIVAGHIDLSVGSVAAFIGAMSGVLVSPLYLGLPWWAAIVISLLVGAVVGAWQGFWVAFVGIPAFIVTLAGMLIFRGLALVALGNQNIGSFPAEYRASSRCPTEPGVTSTSSPCWRVGSRSSESSCSHFARAAAGRAMRKRSNRSAGSCSRWRSPSSASAPSRSRSPRRRVCRSP
jgi:ABC-type xylose transport system permease subunit